MTKQEKALNYLIEQVNAETEFPDAHTNAVEKYNLNPKQSKELIEDYDAWCVAEPLPEKIMEQDLFEEIWREFLTAINEYVFNNKEIEEGKTIKNFIGSADKYKKLLKPIIEKKISLDAE